MNKKKVFWINIPRHYKLQYTINSKKITSIIKLFDGSLIITNDTKVSKEEENENNCKFM